MQRILGAITNFFKKFFLIDDTPHKIAAGAALGVFLGIAPGAGIAASLVLASLFRFNRLAAVTGALATNTWTLFFALPFAAAVGGYLFGMEGSSLTCQYNKIQELGFKFLFSKAIFFDIVLPLTVGFVVVSGGFALIFYILTLALITIHRRSAAK